MSTNPEDDPVVLHRGPVVWDATSFDNTNRLVARDGAPISVDTILILDQFTGKVSQQSRRIRQEYELHGSDRDDALILTSFQSHLLIQTLLSYRQLS